MSDVTDYLIELENRIEQGQPIDSDLELQKLAILAVRRDSEFVDELLELHEQADNELDRS